MGEVYKAPDAGCLRTTPGPSSSGSREWRPRIACSWLRGWHTAPAGRSLMSSTRCMPSNKWVEDGTPPTALIASHALDGRVDRTRPLCRYRQTARYRGTGSTDNEELPVGGAALGSGPQTRSMAEQGRRRSNLSHRIALRGPHRPNSTSRGFSEFAPVRVRVRSSDQLVSSSVSSNRWKLLASFRCTAAQLAVHVEQHVQEHLGFRRREQGNHMRPVWCDIVPGRQPEISEPRVGPQSGFLHLE